MRNIKSAQRILDVHTVLSNQGNNKVDFYLSTNVVFYHSSIVDIELYSYIDNNPDAT